MRMRTSILAVWCLAVAACGGGGGGGSGSVVGIAPAGVVIAISSSVPAAIANQIVLFESNTASATPGNRLLLPDSAGQSTDLVIASNAKGETLLLGFGNSNASLDVQTTAIALARIATGTLKPLGGIPLVDVTNLIRAVPTYTAFEAAVSAALAKGQPPSSDPPVLAALLAVRGPANSAIADLVAQRSGQPNIHKNAAAEITLPPPAYFISGGGSKKIWVEDVNGDGVNVFNQTLLHWRVEIKNKAGQLIGEHAIMAPFEFEPVNVGGVLIGNPFKWTGWYFGVATTQAMAGNGSGDYQLTLKQDDETRALNAIELVRRGTFFVLDALVDDLGIGADALNQCGKFVAQSIVNEKLVDLLGKPSGEEAMNYIKAALGGLEVKYLWDLFTECKPAGWDPELSLKKLPSWAGKTFKLWSELEAGAAAADLYVMVDSAFDFWNADMTQRVCKSQGALRPCQVNIALTSPVSSLIVGQSASLVGSASTLAGVPMSLPMQATWSSTNPDIVSVAPSGQVTANAAGIALISLTDSVSGNSQAVTITVAACSSVMPLQAEAHAAARSGTVEQVLDVLCRGWPVNADIDAEKNGMLNAAIEDCSLPKVTALFQAGAVKVLNIFNDSSLVIAQSRCGGSHPVTQLVASTP